MKRISSALFLVALTSLSLLLVSCNGSTQEDDNGTAAIEESSLKLRLNIGDTFRMAFIVEEAVSEGLFSLATQTGFSIQRTLRFEVIDVAGNGNVKLNSTIENIEILDGEGTASDPGVEAIRELIASENSFEVILSPSGQILGMDGFGVMFEAFLDGFLKSDAYEGLVGTPFPAGEDSNDNGSEAGENMADEFAKALLQPMFEVFSGEETMRVLLEIAFAGLPKSAQKVGDEWTDTQSLSQTISVRLPSQNRWLWRETTSDLAKLDVAFDFDPDAEALTRDVGVAEFSFSDIHGSGDGSFEYDLTSGWPMRVRIKHEMSGTMTGSLTSLNFSSTEPIEPRDFSNATEISIDLIVED